MDQLGPRPRFSGREGRKINHHSHDTRILLVESENVNNTAFPVWQTEFVTEKNTDDEMIFARPFLSYGSWAKTISQISFISRPQTTLFFCPIFHRRKTTTTITSSSASTCTSFRAVLNLGTSTYNNFPTSAETRTPVRSFLSALSPYRVPKHGSMQRGISLLTSPWK